MHIYACVQYNPNGELHLPDVARRRRFEGEKYAIAYSQKREVLDVASQTKNERQVFIVLKDETTLTIRENTVRTSQRQIGVE
jgi:hypothetical protein